MYRKLKIKGDRNMIHKNNGYNIMVLKGSKVIEQKRYKTLLNAEKFYNKMLIKYDLPNYSVLLDDDTNLTIKSNGLFTMTFGSKALKSRVRS
jgi:hypothetical protein